MILPPIINVLAIAETAPSAEVNISLGNAVLALLVLAFFILFKAHTDLRQRLSELEEKLGSAPPPAVPAPTSTAAPAAISEPVPPEILIVIAAAVHASLGQNQRIVSVTPAHDDRHAWSIEGRRQIFQSHRVR